MKKCMIYHTGIRNSAVGVIKDKKVYIQGENNTLYFPKEMFMAIEECECGFIQFEVDGKWGLINNQNKTKQNKTKQNKTKQNKTKQNKTKQNNNTF